MCATLEAYQIGALHVSTQITCTLILKKYVVRIQVGDAKTRTNDILNLIWYIYILFYFVFDFPCIYLSFIFFYKLFYCLHLFYPNFLCSKP